MSDPIAAAEAAGKARDIANRFETAVFLIAYGIAEKDGLYEADPHRYPYSQAFRHGMNILAALCAECSDDAEELLPTFNESDFIRNSAASDVREWTARWRDECREAVEGCRSIEIGPLASVDGDYFAATSECYEVLRFAENDLLGGHQERRVYEFLRAGTQEQYAYGRRMLIRHPLLTWNEYVRIKTGLALGDPDPLDQGEADTIDPVWLQEFVSMAYEPVPGAAKVCPNCGWTMTMRGKQPHCSSATCAKAVTGDFDKLDSVAHDAFRLSRGVMHYISSPGKLELAIAEAAAGLGLKYEMWPLKDTCDILIHLPDGRMPCRRRQGIRPRRAACPRDRGRHRHRPDVRGRGGLCRAGPSRTGPSRISRAMQCRPARQDRLFMRNAAQLLETTRCRREGRHAMSEPNDTAQEGFDQLKRNLEVRYPEDSDLSLDEFLNVESLLALAVRVCGPGADPRKADRLLSNYQLIRPETIGADGHLMQMARRHLFSLASSTAWRRLLGLYERAEYERYRFFDIANGGMALREHPLTGIDRMPIYIDRLLGDVKLSHKNVVARPKGRYSYTCKPEATGDTTVTGSIRWVTIPDAVPPQTGKIDDIPRKSRRPPIDITLDELISTADEVGEKTGKTHYAAVLRRVKDQGLLKRARGGSTSVADGLRLDEVVSLVGLVGAGKSVLANMLIVCLAKRGLRAVSLLNSVSDVMESVVLLREAGISASPLVSRGRRIERLDEFFDHDDSMLLDHSASKYLETACIMDGLSSSDPEACGYGSTPCRGLRSKKGGANSCPYWDVCPSQAMARESLTSDVVVTTPTGFATMIVGRERKAFFEEALQQFDVVLFDEADRVQAQLDGCFAPSMSFQELIRNAADPTAVAMKRRPDDKMRDFNEELFYDLRQKSEPVAKALLKSVRDDRVAKWRIVKDEAFTSLSLLNDLLNRMENTGDSQAKIRWRKVAAALPEATDPTACIVVLPGAESYKPKGKDDGGDPKRALRIAFAKTGRLTQFIEPEDSKDSPEIRARVAVRDLMRQLGFVPEPARNSRGIDTSIPAIGLKVYNSGNGKARASFPYCVRQDMRSGAVTVYCPLLPDGSLPYWRALIEFARLSGSEGFPDSCKRANGMALKRMLHGIVRATGDRPELLLVNSYGRIRQRDWWPGISDSGLESGPLSYGPTGYEEPLGLAGSKLRILRIRSGLNGEVPDWFTDEVAAGGADDGTVPNRRDKQGLFKMDGYFLALAPRPGDAQYKWSARGSKYDSPTAAFCEKTINEYCLLSPGGEAEALASVKYAEALRGCMVQLYKNDMRVDLPAPLHLAEQVEEYIWDWELTGRR